MFFQFFPICTCLDFIFCYEFIFVFIPFKRVFFRQINNSLQFFNFPPNEVIEINPFFPFLELMKKPRIIVVIKSYALVSEFLSFLLFLNTYYFLVD